MTDQLRIDGEDVQARLYCALRDNGLWPDWGSFESGRELTMHWGENHLADLRRTIGVRAWLGGLREFAVPIAEIDLVRILGFGELLTEFAIAPLDIPLALRPGAVRLGALANLVVTLYDHSLDGPAMGRAIIPRGAIEASRYSTRRTLSWKRFIGAPNERLMIRLVHMYYTELDRLARRSPRADAVLPVIHRAILRMYDAESLTVSHCSQPELSTLRRKAALPFVVMGLPGRLVAPTDRRRDSWHLRWLYRLGMHFGAIDDIVDLESDRREDVPNAFGAALSKSDPDVTLPRAMHDLVARAKWLVESWHRRVSQATLTHPATAQALEITTCSWLGGIGWQPRDEVRAVGWYVEGGPIGAGMPAKPLLS